MAISATQLLAQSAVRLFGWVVGEVDWRTPASAPKPSAKGGAGASGRSASAQPHLLLSSSESAASADAKLLANVLAFSNEGRYMPFRAPALFLMLDEGEPVWEGGKVDPDPARLGLAQLDKNMVFASDLRFWICDRSNYIRRLDMSAGTVQLVVIDLETSGAQGRRIDRVGQGSSYMARLGQGTY